MRGHQETLGGEAERVDVGDRVTVNWIQSTLSTGHTDSDANSHDVLLHTHVLVDTVLCLREWTPDFIDFPDPPRLPPRPFLSPQTSRPCSYPKTRVGGLGSNLETPQGVPSLVRVVEGS